MGTPRIAAHWRDSARIPRFFVIDGRAAFPMLIFLVHMRWWTFYATFGVTAFFGLVEHYGYTVTVFLRLFRTALAGKVKQVKPWWREERMN
jgi:intracellular multiplication protein IcmT